MSKLGWTPWHKVVQLRDDLKSGELSLAAFAADIYDVSMRKARPVYQDPKEFFALTYPTFNLRELAKDVVLRLAAKSEKAVRQLELTYGGGKTHSLITLFHLANDPDALPNLPTVQEFIQHIGLRPPKTRVAVIAFDRLDPTVGMEVRAPDGTTARYKYPWSVLAFQLGGKEGIKILGASDDAEREEPPFTNVLGDLLQLPKRDGLATLVLIDEVLMWARTMMGSDQKWSHRLQDFFQCLTQAATKIDTCAIVASLLATDPRKNDPLGKQIANDLYGIFRREREETVQPVTKDDVAEILRRRFFKPDSIRDREGFRPHVVAALKGIIELDDQTRKEGTSAEERYLASYPFHPDLTNILYSKWTNLEGFQRTRGVLRTFALALRDAEQWDECPLIGANVFLGDPKKPQIAEGARELTSVATTEEYEGRRQDWNGILQGESDKARDVQREFTGLRHREIEQAVFATFLHSQPIGQKALTRELMLLVGHTRPDKIDLEKGLVRWADLSWFLDDEAIQGAETSADGQKQLPKSWRLGSKPNLKQMHYDACEHRVPAELVEIRLLDEIGKVKNLTAGASAAGAKVHSLPEKPRDIDDDGEFHFAILSPKAASDPTKPSDEAKRFINETTAADRPRVFRNAVVLAVPSRDGLEAARSVIRDYLGWEEVRSELRDRNLEETDPIRWQTLTASLEGAHKKIPDTIQQAYTIVVTVSDKNEIIAFKITTGSEPLFNQIKADNRSRIQDTSISADALVPGGPYDLWRQGESFRRVKDLVGAFAQFTQLPKMLNRRAILDTLVLGCKEGLFVLRLTRPDRSVKTFWMQEPDDASLKEPSLEAVLPESAQLTELTPALLIPGTLPGLWGKPEISFKELKAYFSGKHIVKIKREGFEEPLTIPQATEQVLTTAVQDAVHDGKLWLISGPSSIFDERIPPGLLNDDATLQAPPQPIQVNDVLPQNLPDAWSGESTTAYALSAALSKRVGKTLPWKILRDAIDNAYRARLLERTIDSAPWPCEYAEAQNVRMKMPGKDAAPPPPPPPFVPKPGVFVAEADLRTNEIQDLAEHIADLTRAAVGQDLKFHLRLELGGANKPTTDVVARINEILKKVSEKLKLG